MDTINNKDKICGIYQITNPKGFSYIGQSRNIGNRWKSYINLNCKKQPRLYNSLKKYGVKNHIFKILEKCDLEFLNEKEVYWDNLNNLKLNIYPCGRGMLYQKKLKEYVKIFQFDKTGNQLASPMLGHKPLIKKIAKTYNLDKIVFSFGFIWVSSNYTKLFLDKNTFIKKIILKKEKTIFLMKRTDIQKEHLRKINLGKKLSQDTKIKLSKNKKENFSKEHLDKMLKAFHKSKCYKILRKSILQYDLNDNFIKEWESITKAAEHYSKIFCWLLFPQL